jgi:DNA/RNA endonuclease G (NUC1)
MKHKIFLTLSVAMISFASLMSTQANAFGLSDLKNSLQSITHSKINTQELHVAGKCPEKYPFGAPEVTSSDKDKVNRRMFNLCRISYAVGFDPAYKDPLWSSEVLTSENVTGSREARVDDFQVDSDVPAPAQASLSDYKGSHFDRGHMSPFADMKVANDKATSEQAGDQSFKLTNMVPQVGMNQNRGIWADLEKKVRGWAKDRGTLYVVTGPIFDGKVDSIGSSHVAVPTRLYKIVVDPKTMQSIAFIIPNVQVITRKTHKLDDGTDEHPQTTPKMAVNCGKTCSIYDFVANVSDVQKATNLKFNSALKPSEQERLLTTDKSAWGVR